MSARFSEMLVNRRRRLGVTVQQVANVIKIRPQILESFESGDFANMPARGYAQGMLSSYARYLGLNPRDVIDAYLADMREYEQGSASSYTGSYLDAATDAVPRRGNAGGYAPGQPGLTSSRYARRPPQAGYVPDSRLSAGRTTRMPRPQDPGVTNPNMTRRAPSSARPGGRRPAPRAASGRPSGRPAPGGRGPRGQRPRRGVSPFSDPRVLMAIAAGVLVLLIVLIVFLVRGCVSGGGEEQQAESVPVTEAVTSDTASDQADEPAADTADEGDEPAADTDKAETKEAEKEPVASEYKVVVTVADGESAWLEIKNGGETVYADNVVGPEELKYTVTDSLEISTDNTSAVGVTKDGEDVSYDSESGGIGRITVTVPKAASSDKDDASKSDDSDSSASASE